MNAQIIAIANQKRWRWKDNHLCQSRHRAGPDRQKVLLIDGDSQSSLTISLGNPQPDKFPVTLSGMDVSLVNAMSRETILRQYLDTVKRDYTHILIDCQPSLDMLKVNANRVLIPVQADQSQTANRRYSADHGRQPYQLCQRDQRLAAGYLRQQNHGIRHRYSSFRSGQ